METIGGLLSSLDKRIPVLWIVLVGVLYLGFKVHQIDYKLGNHITDTNKKIETLSGRIDKLADRFDKMSDRFDRQNDQFVRLYELVIKDKAK